MTPTPTVSTPPTTTPTRLTGRGDPATDIIWSQDIVCADLDMLVLRTGEIVASVGTWRTWPVRTRLCYYPDSDGPTFIGGVRYRKVTYERRGHIPATTQILALPGENHYLVDEAAVRQHYTAVPAGSESPAAVREHAREFEAAGMTPDSAGPGSSAANGPAPTSTG